MTVTAAILLLAAAVTHAGWNFMGKRQGSTVGFFLVANTVGMLTLLAVVLLTPSARENFSSALFMPALSTMAWSMPGIWGWILLTGLFQALYYIGLAGAYRNGDLSLAYPLLRAVPVVLVALANVALGKAAQISPLAFGGMCLVALGAVLLPMKKISAPSRLPQIQQRPLNLGEAPRKGPGSPPFSDAVSGAENRGCWIGQAVIAWALFAAVNTVGYSLVDDHALRLLRAEAASGIGVTLVYAFWEGLAASFWLCLFVLGRVHERSSLVSTLRTRLGQSAVTGVGVYLAYTLVLVAMGYVRNVSYVVAFRQASILLGALLGMVVLKEPAYLPRVAGVLLLFAGLVLVGLG